MNIIRRRSKYPLLSPSLKVCDVCGEVLKKEISLWRKAENAEGNIVQVMFKRTYTCSSHPPVKKYTPFIADKRRLGKLK